MPTSLEITGVAALAWLAGAVLTMSAAVWLATVDRRRAAASLVVVLTGCACLVAFAGARGIAALELGIAAMLGVIVARGKATTHGEPPETAVTPLAPQRPPARRILVAAVIIALIAALLGGTWLAASRLATAAARLESPRVPTAGSVVRAHAMPALVGIVMLFIALAGTRTFAGRRAATPSSGPAP